MGTEVRVVVPDDLYLALKEEAEAAGVPMASLVRIAIKERHERQKLLEQMICDELVDAFQS